MIWLLLVHSASYVPLWPIVFKIVLPRLVITLKDPAFLHQNMKVPYLLISYSSFNVRPQSILKLDAFGVLIYSSAVWRIELSQLFKFGCLLANRHILLLQLKEFYLLLSLDVIREILLQEFSFEHRPINLLIRLKKLFLGLGPPSLSFPG